MWKYHCRGEYYGTGKYHSVVVSTMEFENITDVVTTMECGNITVMVSTMERGNITVVVSTLRWICYSKLTDLGN